MSDSRSWAPNYHAVLGVELGVGGQGACEEACVLPWEIEQTCACLQGRRTSRAHGRGGPEQQVAAAGQDREAPKINQENIHAHCPSAHPSAPRFSEAPVKAHCKEGDVKDETRTVPEGTTLALSVLASLFHMHTAIHMCTIHTYMHL